MNSSAGELCGYASVAEPDLVFAGNKTDKHPLRGLIDHGPYSLKFGAPSSVRFALLAPRQDMAKLIGITEELKRTVKPREAVNYYPTYPGFQALFRIPISDIGDRMKIAFPDELDRHAQRGEKQ